ncbi:hypothetical protein [Methylobacterium soli]|uniref:Uncharacterized protein n=1 Tax=Methylobacterium soli TaxID=553447 RepID=A0A6L3SU81_9HYPH|nr:hypothetical protein [Methylobacterium soli]KAB1077172.1 hypothetical protein F6X53_20035 [Methylobacterium soli]
MPKLAPLPKDTIALPESARVVATEMATGAGYNTGAVAWIVGRGRRRKPSPNRAMIRARHGRLRRWFRKHSRAHDDLVAISSTVAACGQRRLRHRCRHPACPRCAHALQRLLVQVVHRCRVRYPSEAWVTMSIILPVLEPAGAIDFVAERERYAALLRASGITLGVFGLDLSFNEDDRRALPAAERFAPHACVHLFGLALAAEMAAAEPELKRRLPATDVIRRPVRIKSWDGGLTAIAYAHKPEFQRRQTILKFDKRRGKSVRTTRNRPLTVEQQIRAVRALDRAGLTGRIILVGLDFKITNLGRLQLVPAT